LRRPATVDEKADLTALWNSQSATPQVGAKLVLQALLTKPSFLYRAEIGGGTEEVRPLGDFEIASRLSFFATGGPPDEALLAEAAAGTLASKDVILREFQRLSQGLNAQKSVESFYGQWLGVGELSKSKKDEILFPKFTEEVRAQLKTETLSFFTAAHKNKESFPSLFSSRRTFVSQKTAWLSGLTSTATAPEQVELPADTARGGFLTLPGILAATGHSPDHASPLFRGKFVRFNLLCLPLAVADASVKIELPPLEPGMTTRQRYDLILTNKTCAGCHQMMNPIGYGLLSFNAIGEKVDTDAKKPIDDTGAFNGTADIDGPFAGAKGLNDKLASSTLVQECFASQWLQFALARPAQKAEACTVAPKWSWPWTAISPGSERWNTAALAASMFSNGWAPTFKATPWVAPMETVRKDFTAWRTTKTTQVHAKSSCGPTSGTRENSSTCSNSSIRFLRVKERCSITPW
jgi:Protein of unknown function (DUF1592)/Protein of unknown function (DUF1588)/Protein of unknown function (DUF1585)